MLIWNEFTLGFGDKMKYKIYKGYREKFFFERMSYNLHKKYLDFMGEYIRRGFCDKYSSNNESEINTYIVEQMVLLDEYRQIQKKKEKFINIIEKELNKWHKKKRNCIKNADR